MGPWCSQQGIDTGHRGTAGGGLSRTLAPGRGRPGLAPGVGDTEEGANTHATVVLSNCSARPSMADDCKYGSSLSVCLSVRCVSVLASPVPVSCGCPRPARALLWPPAPRRSPSSRCPLGTGPSWVFSGGTEPGHFWGAWIWGCKAQCWGGDGDGQLGQCHAFGAAEAGPSPTSCSVPGGGDGGHWSRSRASGACRADGGSSSPLVPQFPHGRAVAVARAAAPRRWGASCWDTRSRPGGWQQARGFSPGRVPEPGLVAPFLGAAAGSQHGSDRAASVLPRLLGLGLSRAREGPRPPRPAPTSSTGSTAAWVRPGADLRGQTLVPIPPVPFISNSSIWKELGPAPSSPPQPHIPEGGVCVVPALWGTRSSCPPITLCLGFLPG